MADKRLTFDHLRAEHLTAANCAPGTPFAHLLGKQPALTSAPLVTGNAAAIVTAGEKARRAQEGAK